MWFLLPESGKSSCRSDGSVGFRFVWKSSHKWSANGKGYSQPRKPRASILPAWEYPENQRAGRPSRQQSRPS